MHTPEKKHLSGLENHQFRRISFNLTRIFMRGNIPRVDTLFFGPNCSSPKLFVLAHCTLSDSAENSNFPRFRDKEKRTVQMHFPVSRKNPFDWDFPLRGKKKRSKIVLCLLPHTWFLTLFSISSTATKPKMRSHYRGHKMALWLNLIPQLHRPGDAEVSMRHHHFREREPHFYAGKFLKVFASSGLHTSREIFGT